MKTRIREHKYALKTGDEKNGIAVHIQEEYHRTDWENARVENVVPHIGREGWWKLLRSELNIRTCTCTYNELRLWFTTVTVLGCSFSCNVILIPHCYYYYHPVIRPSALCSCLLVYFHNHWYLVAMFFTLDIPFLCHHHSVLTHTYMYTCTTDMKAFMVELLLYIHVYLLRSLLNNYQSTVVVVVVCEA